MDFRRSDILRLHEMMMSIAGYEYGGQYKTDDSFAVVHGKRITKKARVEATVLNSLTPISKADICQILPDVSPTTVEAVLGAMVKNGSIKRLGLGRNTRYIKI